jgi:hypothetical protein
MRLRYMGAWMLAGRFAHNCCCLIKVPGSFIEHPCTNCEQCDYVLMRVAVAWPGCWQPPAFLINALRSHQVLVLKPIKLSLY